MKETFIFDLASQASFKVNFTFIFQHVGSVKSVASPKYELNPLKQSSDNLSKIQ